MEFIILAVIAIFVVSYRNNKGENVYKYVQEKTLVLYDRFAPYSFKIISEQVKRLGLEYTPRQYLIQIVLFATGAFVISYLYFYSLITSVLYMVVATGIIPYLAYLRYKRIYSEFIFEQIQVYTTNTIMEFATTQAFVKALEGVLSSGVLEEPVSSDVRMMINMSYENGVVDDAVAYMNNKYDYHIMKNMHQLFTQITKEGARDSGESMDNMLLDIDMLVESVYRDRIDRNTFHKSFLKYGIMLYLMVMLVQYLVGQSSYLKLVDLWYVKVLLHGVIIANSYFLVSGERYYNENVGAE